MPSFVVTWGELYPSQMHLGGTLVAVSWSFGPFSFRVEGRVWEGHVLSKINRCTKVDAKNVSGSKKLS